MFITLEGPEGAGKSSILPALSDLISSRFGKEVVPTREPGSGELGARIRSVLLDGAGMPPESELFLFLADRANHVKSVVRPALESRRVVLCDRHADSTLVYQSFARGLDEAFVRRANAFATAGLQPDLTLLFDLDPTVGLARLSRPDRLDREPIEFHERVRAGFLRLAAEEPGRCKVLDASQPRESVLQQAWNAIVDAFPNP